LTDKAENSSLEKKKSDYLNSWIAMIKDSQSLQKAYDRWILGKGAEEQKPRWSIIRNVLHWVQ